MSKASLFIATVEGTAAGVSAVSEVRIAPSALLADAAAFVDLRDRVRQHLAAQDTAYVGIVETRKRNSWAYKDAYRRVFAVCTVFEATAHLQVPCATVRTEDIARSVSTLAKSLSDFRWEEVGFEAKPAHWNAGLGDASACAVHLCRSEAEASRG